MTIRSYSEVSQFSTFDERFEYLKLGGGIGRSTFGFDRYVNQEFYRSKEWHDVRQFVIVRDNGWDLGMDGYLIPANPIVHHMNPMEVEDIVHNTEWILNPEYLILTAHRTHNAIHFGTDQVQPRVVTARQPNDTKLW